MRIDEIFLEIKFSETWIWFESLPYSKYDIFFIFTNILVEVYRVGR